MSSQYGIPFMSKPWVVQCAVLEYFQIRKTSGHCCTASEPNYSLISAILFIA